jgi:hypothetical protein
MSDAIQETTAEEPMTDGAIAANQSNDGERAAVWSFGRSFGPVAPPSEEPSTAPAKLDNAAYHGLAGQIVNTISPHSEGDPAALLVLLLMGLGSVVGRNPHFKVEATDHYLNLFAVLVGNTAKARKGTVTDRIKHFFRLVEGIVKERLAVLRTAAGATAKVAHILDLEQHLPGRLNVKGGLSSGEGLIWAVRDPIPSRSMNVADDPGVEDKRLLVLEAEFASTLKVMAREGNILSPILRDAWDDLDVLHTLTKNNPATATRGHISLLGHVTASELRRYVDRTELGNGFANRFLWLSVERSKFLPRGGALTDADLLPFADQVADILMEIAERKDQVIRRSDAADAEWDELYRDLSTGRAGLLGAVTARAEAQVMRLACLYALFDRSYVVEPEHLDAALAVWRYCERSVEEVFGDAVGDPVADEILRQLRRSEDGLTRTDIRDVFKRNKSESEITKALTVLEEHRLARMVLEPSPENGGRRPERWFATEREHKPWMTTYDQTSDGRGRWGGRNPGW